MDLAKADKLRFSEALAEPRGRGISFKFCTNVSLSYVKTDGGSVAVDICLRSINDAQATALVAINADPPTPKSAAIKQLKDEILLVKEQLSLKEEENYKLTITTHSEPRPRGSAKASENLLICPLLPNPNFYALRSMFFFVFPSSILPVSVYFV